MTSLNNAPGMHLQDLILDTKATASKEQKAECLKLLRTVVKNLADPTKKDDPKYRQLRLSNEKVAAKLLPCPSGLAYMESIGFSQIDDKDGSKYLRMETSKQINISNMHAALMEITNAYNMVAPDNKKEPVHKPNRHFSEEKKTPDGILKKPTVVSSSVTTSTKLTEKQKARLLLEKKKQEEEVKAKRAHIRTREQIKQDKHVRENDENWKSCQSAACVKSGDAITTFSETFGE
mmetsp:Transcript_25274/g.24225  ORF Transcript_25274/g.24225 Transcript_25274/m.24225 type:complete len:234 (-) Transcript_25274:176-877(-)|eukprot:CAMPEP_0197825906 /NCGR_PEP_ID=MMETSP1437-20131217/2939_1 /TAXON_ID=49252 ORGANISM="Eucampia antarctica, Strain CCMP1452" /NCGR_SAMPLE_ID=MMETSP1437 /ASSEMBLY_ACC=CAM_ASM_001096 /LENGTH=233 /DNA_ID=CAMNT_0043426121 /DNA_START=39 /DNA_END=740 /DNA_ORIENTATION=-